MGCLFFSFSLSFLDRKSSYNNSGRGGLSYDEPGNFIYYLRGADNGRKAC